ncbi:alginate export family protein [uncultured Paludibaculum sp.]|uniref:alginate export family protein n=1 Tax=uncultured Paludibaculum sp. TaxID=1765020 RepID=UPI002AAA98FC|nr:alginate export family protein [uncultured Paludibaculum sp.]
MQHLRWVTVTVVCLVPSALQGQWWAAGDLLNEELGKETHGTLAVSLEFRSRLEQRQGQAFGADPDRSVDLLRTRVGLAWKPVSWLKIAGKLQDSRGPMYGANAPNNVRDPVDLHEAYVEIRPDANRGFGLSVGRRMLNYGDGRLLGVPDWGNTARTFDHARVWWLAGKAHLEVLVVSAPKVRPDEFNRPGLGDRVWGTYNILPEIKGGHKAEVYILRHDQNGPGGFTGQGTLGVTSFGSRWTGPVAAGWKYVIEGVVQRGHVGPASQRAGAWSSVFQKSIGKVDLSGEYKFASGTENPADRGRSGTFDQMYAANHDKFGHQDLFGWRNMHDVRAVASWKVRPRVTLNAMYDSYWLARKRDALYGLNGRAIAKSTDGTAGRHVGQDVDFFAAWRPVKPLLLGAGVGVFVNGEFVKNTTPGVAPVYFYVFQTYSF